MADDSMSIIGKIVGLTVIVIILCSVALPIISDQNTEKQNNTLLSGDARGDFDGTTWTASDTGAWVKVAVLTSDAGTYYLAPDATYYAENTSDEMTAFKAPSTTDVNTNLTLTFSAEVNDDGFYTLTPTATTAGDYIYIPYQASYEINTLIGILPILLIVMVVLIAVRMWDHSRLE